MISNWGNNYIGERVVIVDRRLKGCGREAMGYVRPREQTNFELTVFAGRIYSMPSHLKLECATANRIVPRFGSSFFHKKQNGRHVFQPIPEKWQIGQTETDGIF